MTVTIQIKGANKVVKLFNKLPGNINSEGDKLVLRIVKSLQRRARMRAPVETGNLWESIQARKASKGVAILEVDSPYAMAQEFGFTPHWIPIEFVEQHLADPGIPGQWVDNPKGWILSQWKNGPFIRPAVSGVLKDLPKWALESTKLAIKKSGG